MSSTALIKDPSPGVTPGDGSIIRTDSYNLIVDILNGVSTGSKTSLVQKYVTKTANYTLTAEDFSVCVDASGGALTMTLPDAGAAGIVGRLFNVHKTDASDNVVTLACYGSQTIDGETTRRLASQFCSFLVMSIGTGWIVVAHPGRQPFAQISDNTNQNPTGTTPVQVTFSTNDGLVGITHTGGSGDITVLESGVYWIMAAGQFGKTGGTVIANCDLWLRKNSTDIPNTNTRLSLPVLATSTDVLVSQCSIRLVAGDVIKVFQSVSTLTDTPGLKVTSPAGEPVIPSIIFTMNKISD